MSATESAEADVDLKALEARVVTAVRAVETFKAAKSGDLAAARDVAANVLAAAILAGVDLTGIPALIEGNLDLVVEAVGRLRGDPGKIAAVRVGFPVSPAQGPFGAASIPVLRVDDGAKPANTVATAVEQAAKDAVATFKAAFKTGDRLAMYGGAGDGDICFWHFHEGVCLIRKNTVSALLRLSVRGDDSLLQEGGQHNVLYVVDVAIPSGERLGVGVGQDFKQAATSAFTVALWTLEGHWWKRRRFHEAICGPFPIHALVDRVQSPEKLAAVAALLHAFQRR